MSAATGVEMAQAFADCKANIRADEVLACHFANIHIAERIVGVELESFQTLVEGWGGFPVVFSEECPMSELMWNQHHGGRFRSEASWQLWGEKQSNVLIDGKEADLDVVLFIAIPKGWIDTATVVPGRDLLHIISLDCVLQDLDGHHQGKFRHELIKRLCVLKRGVEVWPACPEDVLMQQMKRLKDRLAVKHVRESLADGKAIVQFVIKPRDGTLAVATLQEPNVHAVVEGLQTISPESFRLVELELTLEESQRARLSRMLRRMQTGRTGARVSARSKHRAWRDEPEPELVEIDDLETLLNAIRSG
jgi:hypothetical protein